MVDLGGTSMDGVAAVCESDEYAATRGDYLLGLFCVTEKRRLVSRLQRLLIQGRGTSTAADERPG